MHSINNPFTAWIIVLVSGALEVVFSVSMKFSEGYSKPLPSTLSIIAAVLSVWLMSSTLKVLPVGTAYAVWAGIGAAGTALFGVLWFGEPSHAGRLACLAAIMIGIIGLQLQSST